MKKIGILFSILLISASTFAQSSIKSFLSELEDQDDYAIVTINREMFKLIASFDVDMGVDEKEIRELVSNIKKVKIYTNETSSNYDDFKSLKSLANNANMDNLISVKDGSERIELYTNPTLEESVVDGLLLLVRESDSNVFIHMDGRINLNTLAKLTEKLDIDGLNHLNKIGDR